MGSRKSSKPKKPKKTTKKNRARTYYTICISKSKTDDWEKHIITDQNKILTAFNSFKCLIYQKDRSVNEVDVVIAYVTEADDPLIIQLMTDAYRYKKPIAIIYRNFEIAHQSKILRSFRVNEFCLENGSEIMFWGTAPWKVAKNFLLWHGYFCQSPLEKQFWNMIKTEVQGMKIQYPIPVNNHEYNVDFAIPKLKIVIEIDGYAYHDRNRDDFVKERVRLREIQSLGWIVIPFAGREIKYECKNCVDFVKKEIDRVSNQRT